MATTSHLHADYDGTTVRGGSIAGDYPTKSSKDAHDHPAKSSPPRVPDIHVPNAVDLPFVDAEQYLDTKRPYCVRVDGARGGVLGALHELDRELRENGHPSIFSHKDPVTWAGREVSPGSIGVYTHSASPKIITKSGRYPGFPFGWWWARDWEGTFNLTDTLFENHGLVMLQVSQNQAAICQDPQNQIFVVKNSGFVALAVEGTYKVLDIVDQTHLSNAMIDKYTKTVLAYSQDVLMSKKFVAATFLDIPANNVVVLQRENQLYELGAGQHHITQANVKIRGAFTRGEVQHELVADDIYTRDQVPVMMRVYLRWELQHPLLLTRHGYETPFDALQDKTRSILTQILAHLDYSSMAKSRNIGTSLADPSNKDHEDDAQAAFVDAVRTQATDDLAVVAVEYGILLKDLAIVDRKFKGEIARVMDHLTTRALEAQVESTNLDRENNNRRKKQEGDLRVAELENQQRKAKAEADAQTAVAAAKGRAEALRLESEAAAQAILVKARAEAEASRTVGAADAAIGDAFAQTQARARLEVQRTAAFGDKTVFVSTEMSGLGDALAFGKAMEVARKK